MHCNRYGYHCLLIGRNLNMNRFRSNLVCRYYRGLQTELCKFRYHSNHRRGQWRPLIGWNSIMSDYVQISYVVVFVDCNHNCASFVAMATSWEWGDSYYNYKLSSLIIRIILFQSPKSSKTTFQHN